ncbi:MAG: SDR family oxidoreductase [Longimicrobiales bacterium]|nr:SDR family oxidoreductase [Longimicrobiales bacterium]
MKTLDLAGRRVVVTGATGGIGRAVARALAGAGAELFLVARTRDRLAAVADEVGGTAVPGDAGDPGDVESIRAVVDAAGGAHALVSAAGTFDLAPVAETAPAMFERMIHGNLRAPFLVTRALLPGMLERGEGHVVTVGSVAGRVAFPGNGAYSASKFGVRGLHEVLVAELRGTGVRATLVEPAATDTGIWDPLAPDDRDDLPGRGDMLDPIAVAEAVIFALTRPPSVSVPTVAVQRS